MERASRIFYGLFTPLYQKIVRLIFALQFFLLGFSWEAVRRLLKSDKVTEARCDQHNTEQEMSPIPVLALLTTFFFCKTPEKRKKLMQKLEFIKAA